MAQNQKKRPGARDYGRRHQMEHGAPAGVITDTLKAMHSTHAVSWVCLAVCMEARAGAGMVGSSFTSSGASQEFLSSSGFIKQNLEDTVESLDTLLRPQAQLSALGMLGASREP